MVILCGKIMLGGISRTNLAAEPLMRLRVNGTDNQAVAFSPRSGRIPTISVSKTVSFSITLSIS